MQPFRPMTPATVYQSRKDDPLRGLDHAARRHIRRAVRTGTAVRDPREAPAAAAYADVVAARENPIPVGLPVILALLGAAALAVVAGVVPPVILLPFAVAIVVRPVQARIVSKAQAAAAANRAFAADIGVERPDVDAPRPAWQGAGPWAVAVCIALLVALHFGIRALPL